MRAGSPRHLRLAAGLVVLAGTCSLFLAGPIIPAALAQQPTGSVPTVTGTPRGAVVTVYLDLGQILVYAGPSMYEYMPIGVLLAGQQASAVGVSADKTWIQIWYPGVPGSTAWVYAPYVSISRGADLPVLEAPFTPTPASTPTIDPTLAAALITPATPARLPTFTAPPPLVVATFTDATADQARLPVGLLIVGFGFLGGLGVLISFLQGR